MQKVKGLVSLSLFPWFLQMTDLPFLVFPDPQILQPQTRSPAICSVIIPLSALHLLALLIKRPLLK